MRHFKSLTKNQPAAASLLETQQKVAIFGAFATALNTLGTALGTWLNLRDEE